MKINDWAYNSIDLFFLKFSRCINVFTLMQRTTFIPCPGLHMKYFYTLTCRDSLFTFSLRVYRGLCFLFLSLLCEFSTTYIFHIHYIRHCPNEFIKKNMFLTTVLYNKSFSKISNLFLSGLFLK